MTSPLPVIRTLYISGFSPSPSSPPLMTTANVKSAPGKCQEHQDTEVVCIAFSRIRKHHPPGLKAAAITKNVEIFIYPYPADGVIPATFLALLTMVKNSSGFKLAPPTKAPSTGSCPIISSALAAVTLPPYNTETFSGS